MDADRGGFSAFVLMCLLDDGWLAVNSTALRGLLSITVYSLAVADYPVVLIV
jgi:hypothetical protein